jgi:hypothetical protein
MREGNINFLATMRMWGVVTSVLHPCLQSVHS